jgi:hypothetical protein
VTVRELIALLQVLDPAALVKVSSEMSSYNEKAIHVQGRPEDGTIWIVGEEDTGD